VFGSKDTLAEVEVEANLLASGFGARPSAAGDVPVVDMSLEPEACARAMFEAAGAVGFFAVTNHGIPQDAIDAAFAASKGFFDQPQEDKAAQCPFWRERNAGYEYMSQVRPATKTPDQKESLQVTARDGVMDGRWPATDGFRATAESFLQQAHALAARILDLLEPLACPHLPKGTLRAAHNLWSPDGQCTLRMLHYPPVDKPEAMPPNYWRAGPHTDWDCVTLLFQRPGEAGLECAPNPKAPGAATASWLRVDPLEGGIAVNIGDMLGRWSNGRLLSNLHRVRMPTPEEATPPRSRYSIAFFMQADRSALIESEGHAPITAGDYIDGRVAKNFAAAAPAE